MVNEVGPVSITDLLLPTGRDLLMTSFSCPRVLIFMQSRPLETPRVTGQALLCILHRRQAPSFGTPLEDRSVEARRPPTQDEMVVAGRNSLGLVVG